MFKFDFLSPLVPSRSVVSEATNNLSKSVDGTSVSSSGRFARKPKSSAQERINKYRLQSPATPDVPTPPVDDQTQQSVSTTPVSTHRITPLPNIHASPQQQQKAAQPHQVSPPPQHFSPLPPSTSPAPPPPPAEAIEEAVAPHISLNKYRYRVPKEDLAMAIIAPRPASPALPVLDQGSGTPTRHVHTKYATYSPQSPTTLMPAASSSSQLAPATVPNPLSRSEGMNPFDPGLSRFSTPGGHVPYQQKSVPQTAKSMLNMPTYEHRIVPDLRPGIVLQRLKWKDYVVDRSSPVEPGESAITMTDSLKLSALMWADADGLADARYSHQRILELERLIPLARAALEKLRAERHRTLEQMNEFMQIKHQEDTAVENEIYEMQKKIEELQAGVANIRACKHLQELIYDMQAENREIEVAGEHVDEEVGDMQGILHDLNLELKSINHEAVKIKLLMEKMHKKNSEPLFENITKVVKTTTIDWYAGAKALSPMLDTIVNMVAKHLGMDWSVYVIEDKDWVYPVPIARKRRHYRLKDLDSTPWMTTKLMYTSASANCTHLVGQYVPDFQGATRGLFTNYQPKAILINDVNHPNKHSNLLWPPGHPENAEKGIPAELISGIVVPTYRYDQDPHKELHRIASSVQKAREAEMMRQRASSRSKPSMLRKSGTFQERNRSPEFLDSIIAADPVSRSLTTESLLPVGADKYSKKFSHVRPKKGAFLAVPVKVEGVTAAALCVDSMERASIMPALTGARVKTCLEVALRMAPIYTKFPRNAAQDALDALQKKQEELMRILNELLARLSSPESKKAMSEMIGYRKSPGRLLEMFVMIILLCDYPDVQGPPYIKVSPIAKYSKTMKVDTDEIRQSSWERIQKILTVDESVMRAKGLRSILDLMKEAPMVDVPKTKFDYVKVNDMVVERINTFQRSDASKISQCAELLYDWITTRLLICELLQEVRRVMLEVQRIRDEMASGRKPADTFRKELREFLQACQKRDQEQREAAEAAAAEAEEAEEREKAAQEKSAIKIQAAFRGHQTRKQLEQDTPEPSGASRSKPPSRVQSGRGGQTPRMPRTPKSKDSPRSPKKGSKSGEDDKTQEGAISPRTKAQREELREILQEAEVKRTKMKWRKKKQRTAFAFARPHIKKIMKERDAAKLKREYAAQGYPPDSWIL